MGFIGVEVEQETSAPPPKKNPGSAPVYSYFEAIFVALYSAASFVGDGLTPEEYGSHP